MANEYDCLNTVSSSMFSKAGYHDETWSLILEFKLTGEIRAYRNVSPETADEALSSESLGKWWNANIKGNPAWEYDVLGAEPLQVPPPVSELKVQSPWMGNMGLTEDDLDLIAPAPESAPQFGVDRFDPETGCRPNSEMDENGNVKGGPFSVNFTEIADWPEDADSMDLYTAQGTHISNIPKGEILDAWEAPKTPVEAITLLQDRKTEIEAIIKQNVETGQTALAIRVNDMATHGAAGKTLAALVDKKDGTFKLLDPFREILYASYGMANKYKKDALDPIDGAIAHIKKQLNAYEDAQERIRQQKIREERERAEAEARERQRKESEQLTLLEVSEALEMGDTAKAEELVDHPIQVPTPFAQPVFIPPAVTQAAGQSVRDNYKIDEESIDLVKFLRAVKDGKVELDVAAKYLLPNLPALNKIAKALETSFSIPGFQVINDKVRSTRRGK